MIEHIILGTVQGIVEWLPVSSEGFIVLIQNNFFQGSGLEEIIKNALFLHLGTFFAALIYFKSEVWELTKSLFKYKEAKEKDKKLINFLIFATLISGGLGIILLEFAKDIAINSQVINIIIGSLLLITGFLQLKIKSGGGRNEKDLNWIDSTVLGILQGCAALPGLSRSGLTVAGLLLRDIDEEKSLKISFIMSLPIVLGGNVILNFSELTLSIKKLAGLFFAFIFGLITIHYLLKLARNINFGWFVTIFGILILIASFI